ncbi:MAG: SRPBCC family protein [Acidimicrobiales bacterium]
MPQQRTVHAAAERTVDAPAERVYGCIAGMREHHPNFLPPAFSGFEVESGGVGDGTVVRFSITAGGRTRSYRMQVAEPEPGRVLTESDTGSSLVTTFTVEPVGTGARVRVATSWIGGSGVGGFFERLFAPKALQGIYEDELERLAAYAGNLGD